MRPSRILAPALFMAALSGATAQVGVPPIEQEPRPGVVREREAAEGLSLSPQQNRSDQQAVDQIYRELTGNSPNAPAPPAPSAGPPLSQEAGQENRLYQELTGSNPNAPAPAAPR